MTWGQHQLSFQILFGLDLFFALVIFGIAGISISTMAGLVRDGKDAPLRLYGWQRAFLRWLEPKLSREHCAAALQSDIKRCRDALSIMGVQPCSPSPSS